MPDKPLQLRFRCPACEQQNRNRITDAAELVRCEHCGWSRNVVPAHLDGHQPRACLVCGCSDLWRQRDFPQRLGLLFVSAQVVLSTIAVAYYRPFLALGILMGFFLIDFVLYAAMPDVLVCYRCGARHRHAQIGDEHPRFNLETHERYRQEAIRLEESTAAQHRAGEAKP